ncbi:MAG TPA: protein kinase, partial [Gemmataceae bacterium]|nr:protein kinase [Gemmataceae bacterium]
DPAGADARTAGSGDPAATGDLHGAGPTPLPPAVRIPGYTILGELGRGAMGVVYKARDDRLGRTVAIKMILAGGHAGAAARERFAREAKAVAALNHPNVVQIYEIGDANGLPYLALEYVPGGTLLDLVDAGPVPPRRAAELIAVVATAVQAAHAAGLVHRDLKPANILLANDQTPMTNDQSGSSLDIGHWSLRPKVADFGLAKWADSETGPTGTNHVLGTPAYMAPEQCGEGHGPVGPSADVYALGGVLYHLLAGRPPFTGPTALAVLRRVLDEAPAPPRRLRPDVPAELEAVCLKCLEKDPARRYESAAAVADDLNRFLAGEPVRARAPRPARPRSPAWLLVLLVVGPLAVGLLVLLLMGYLLFSRSAGRPDGGAGPTIEKAEGRPEPTAAVMNQDPGGPPAVPPMPGDLAPDALDRVKAAVVQIRVTRPGGGTATGTGFLCQQPGLIVTCAHVLGMHVDAAPPPVRIDVVIGSGTPAVASRTAKLLSVDRTGDLAYLQVAAAGLPTPLAVRTAGDLKELQTLYLAGFTTDPGPDPKTGLPITVLQTRAAALRTDDLGYATSVQIDVSPGPGMSGAPLCDTAGRVVGLLRGLSGPLQRTALIVSGDLLLHLLRERARWLRPGQAVAAGGKLTQPVVLRVADPLNQLSRVELEVATGPDKAPPAGPWRAFPLDTRPDDPAGPGEDRDFVGTLDLPPLGPGEAYWARPRLAGARGTRTEAARVLRSGTVPVEATPAELPAGNPGARAVVEHRSAGVLLEEEAGGGRTSRLAVDATFAETVEARGKDGTTVRLRITRFEPSVQGAPEHMIQEAQTAPVGQELTVAVGPDGAYLAPPDVSTLNLPGNSGRFTRGLLADAASELEALAVSRPGRRVNPGDTWTRETADAGVAGGFWARFPLTRAVYTFRYVGSRTRGGRTEAVVEFKAVPRPGKPDPEALTARGSALIDTASGLVTLAHLTYDFTFTPDPAGKDKMAEQMSVRRTVSIRRTPGTDPPMAAADLDLLPDRPLSFGPTAP